MLKGKLLIALASAVLFLGACSNEAPKPEEPQTNQSTESENTEKPQTNQSAESENTEVKETKIESEDGTNVIEIVYSNGTQVDLNIDLIQADGSSKREASEAGTYDMGGELAWHEQMDLLEDFIVANNFDLGKVTLTDEDGHTDAVTGVSIKVGSYLPLIEQALSENNESTEVKETKIETENGTNVIEITYSNGTPVDLNIDLIQADGSSKREASEAGTYDMGGELAWHEQMDLLEDFIVANNFDLGKVTLTDEDGHTDAVTGVSIKVGSYLPLIEQALENK